MNPEEREQKVLDLFEELTRVIEALDQRGIPYALVGGLAYSILVETRATEDIDLLVHPENWPDIVEALRPLGYLDVAQAMDFANIRIRRLTKLEGEDSLVLDFLFADGKVAQGVEGSLRIRRGTQFISVASPEIIIALKKGRMSKKDQDDIEGLQKLIDGKNQ